MGEVRAIREPRRLGGFQGNIRPTSTHPAGGKTAATTAHQAPNPGVPERLAVILRGVEVAERLQARVDLGHRPGAQDQGRDHLEQGEEPEPIAGQQAFDRREDRGPAIQGGEGVEMAVDLGDGQVVVADQAREMADPPGREERGVGRRRIGQLDPLGQGGQAGAEPLERAATGDEVADDRDGFGQIGQVLAGCGDDHDRVGGEADQADDPGEQRLGAEREPLLGPSHPSAPAAAEDHPSPGFIRSPRPRPGTGP